MAELLHISSPLKPNARPHCDDVSGMVFSAPDRYIVPKAWSVMVDTDYGKGVVFNITHSRLSVITQFTFLGLNTIALLFGALYQAQTPNLYEHNVHGSFGWLLTCIVLAQTLMVMLRRYGISAIHRIQNSHARGHYQPVTQEAMHHHQISQPRQPGHYRCSHDSGQGTELESSNSQTSSPLRKFDEDPFRKIEQAHDGDDGESSDGRSSLRGDAAVGGILTHMTSRYSGHIVKAIEIVRNAIDRVILVLGFVAISSGVVVYGGIFVSDRCNRRETYS